MKSILCVFTLISFAGCASVDCVDFMQPDGSYRIASYGGAYAPKSDVVKESRTRASQLCPRGFDTKSETCFEGFRFKDSCELIIECH